MKREITMNLIEKVGECVIEVSTEISSEKKEEKIQVFFKLDGSGSYESVFDFDRRQLIEMSQFFIRAYEKIGALLES